MLIFMPEIASLKGVPLPYFHQLSALERDTPPPTDDKICERSQRTRCFFISLLIK